MTSARLLIRATKWCRTPKRAGSPSERAPDTRAWPADLAPGFREGRLFAIQSGIGIGDRGVRLVAPLLAVKVPLPVAARSRRLAAAVLRAKALHARPRLDQGAVHREMVVRQQRLNLLLVQYRRHELAGDVTGDQPHTALGEHRHVPHR